MNSISVGHDGCLPGRLLMYRVSRSTLFIRFGIGVRNTSGLAGNGSHFVKDALYTRTCSYCALENTRR